MTPGWCGSVCRLVVLRRGRLVLPVREAHNDDHKPQQWQLRLIFWEPYRHNHHLLRRVAARGQSVRFHERRSTAWLPWCDATVCTMIG
jgi:hypothetical protein